MMSFKKNLGALVTLVILLLSVYSAIWAVEVTSILVILVGLVLSLFGLKSYTGIKTKNIEATMNRGGE